jgi:hypothetical protein
MIIDCHGHYTTAPEPHNVWRDLQKQNFKAGGNTDPAYPDISDDEIVESIEQNQLRLIKQRHADLTVFSPRASTMAHHVGDESVSKAWSPNISSASASCRSPPACPSPTRSPSWSAASTSWASSAAT